MGTAAMDLTLRTQGAFVRTAGKLAICVFIFAILAQFTGYQTGDPDSQFYVYLVRQMAMRAGAEWMAPYWLGEQGIRADDIVRDHLAGHLATGLAFWKLGVHPSASLYVASFLWVASTYLLLNHIMRRFVAPAPALLGTLLSLIFPISFLYRVRANHEQSLLLMCLLIIVVALSVRRVSVQGVLVGILSVAVFLVKGFVFPVVPFLFSIALLFSGGSQLRSWFLGSLVAGVCSLAYVAGTAWFYEQSFQSIAGMPFFETYFQIQLLERSVNLTLGEYPYVFRRLYAVGYYTIQTLWYGLPVTLMGIAWLLTRSNQAKQVDLSKSHLLGRIRNLFVAEHPVLSSDQPLFSAKKGHVQGALLFCALGGGYVALLSLSDRVSGRYVFPAFYFIPIGLYLALVPWIETALRRANHWICCILERSSSSQGRSESVILFFLLILSAVHLFATNKHFRKEFPDELPFKPLRPEYLETR